MPDGLPCPCGRFGCWGTLRFGSSLGNIAEAMKLDGELGHLGSMSSMKRHLTVKELAIWPYRNDKEALKVLRQYSNWVALGLVNLVNI